MYWYYKYTFWLIILIILIGVGNLAWRRFHPASGSPEDPVTVGTEVVLPFPVPDSVDDTPVVPPPATGADGGSDQVADPPDVAVAPSQPVTPPAVLSQAVERRLSTAEEQLAKQNLVGARILAHKVTETDGVVKYGAVWERAVAVISQANTALFNCDAPAPEKVSYKVREGDSLVRIAYRHKTTVGALQRLNRLDPTDSTIFAGNILYVYECDWWISVTKSKFRLLLMNGDELFKCYPACIGRQNRTPVGIFEVNNKVLHPPWKDIPYGHPENVLGTHWLGLKPIEGTDLRLIGYGIHGTWEPETIGTSASQGCIRLRNEDVAELFDLVPSGIRVVIKDDE
ncbi:MAG: L,D-transpeptidase family protein [Lentisphaerae bacterium]|jgi:LysM repeat protein|nr:L,D-transpeptidase family protein [Lentisphaerota bacterium]MBT4814408.1 L,D-transpeptidase family protein [Lentisphaerota bacterium]MBT5606301.1 L,D-transpeptidase family protein [Lentisphaerota bacterium]MBT7059359.1 L,D-transpeptidase family protein [Lentisphaerota bacterium]MBT7848254.1 L,D-transpeptidase family protein [Lentisphaerota bacterium]